MGLNRDYIGRSYEPPRPYHVGAEKIREFAAAIGDDNPAYQSEDAAKELGYPAVIAPPTFAVHIVMQAGPPVVYDAGLGINLRRVVHGEQRFVHHRPIQAGDVLLVTSIVSDIRDAGDNELMTIESELRTSGGELVCSGYNTIVSRGTAARRTPQPAS
jgi:acyl dehydratase